MSAIKTLGKLLGDAKVRITFSINCHSGLASLLGADHKCGCWRCREGRGEAWDEATESQAANDSKQAQERMRALVMSQHKAAR